MVAATGWLSGFFQFGIVANKRHRESHLLGPVPGAGPECNLLVLEFDDQGLWFDHASPRALNDALAALQGRNPVLIVFTHGWQHNAAAEDSNLQAFSKLLAKAAEDGARQAAAHAAPARPILGIFLSWRGLSRTGNIVWQNSSFWDRQQAAHRVALGSPREALEILRAFRNGDGAAPQATLLIVGHSFGGAVIFAAVAQSLIAAALAPGDTVPSFGDLVLLVNPAFSAVSYLPIQSIISRRNFPGGQLPVFVSVTADNDWATGYLFPLGNLYRIPTEATRTVQERTALIRTMGHIASLRTHRLSAVGVSHSGLAAAVAWQPEHERERASMRQLTAAGATQSFGPVKVESLAGHSSSPFWVASATRQVIDGHNGIFQIPFEQFVRALLAAHIQGAK
jgi:pimeloyl-ACP methyl ester carboxylesterase